MHAENLGRILLDKTRNSGAENYGILIRLSADWMGKVDYESEIFLIQRYITLWKGTTASVDIISLSSKLFHDSCFKPAERRKYFFRYSVYVGKNSFDLKQVAIISAETCQMVLNLILASICKEKNWWDEKILVIPVTWQISAQPLVISHRHRHLPIGDHHNIDDDLHYFGKNIDGQWSILMMIMVWWWIIEMIELAPSKDGHPSSLVFLQSVS